MHTTVRTPFHSARLVFAASLLVTACLAQRALAQFGDAWLTLTPSTTKLMNPDLATVADIVSNTDEKDFAVGDVDRDGWLDLAVGKKIQADFIGLREGRFFHNEKGVLVDRTAQFASASDVAGDLGFKQPIETRDVEFVDIDGDGWLDLVTCQIDLTNNTSAAAKVFTHPRIHRNLGLDATGHWLGFRFEDARIPQLLTIPTGVNGVVRFNDLAAADVDGDGDQDLYFTDMDLDENGHSETAGLDLNDRLLLNDGNGYFTDGTATHFGNTGLYSSAFGAACELVDMNHDSRPDIVKVSTLTETPNRVEIVYNDVAPGLPPDFTGGFDRFTIADSSEPFGFVSGDLNNDGRPDLMIGDCAVDHYRFNIGNAGDGTTAFSARLDFSWLTGSGDDGFQGRMRAADYDLDGWLDCIVTDVHLDLASCNRRTKIYHNRGGAPGATDIVLREEKQQSGTGGWFGAVGWSGTYPKGVTDVANIDIDNDGDIDLVLGRCVGTDVWINSTNPVVCQPTVLPTTLGDATLAVCGAPLWSNLTATLTITGGTSNGHAVLLADLDGTTMPAFGGQVMVPADLVFVVPLDPLGGVAFPVPGGGGTKDGLPIHLQAVLVGPLGGNPTDITNVLRIDLRD